MIAGEIQQQANVCISEPVVDPSPVAPSAHHIGGTEQPERLAHHVLGDPGETGKVADAQFAGLEQGMQDRQPGRISEQAEQLRRLDMRLTARHTIAQCIQRRCRLVAMRRTDIEINNRSLARRSHDRHHICAAEQITQQTLTGDT